MRSQYATRTALLMLLVCAPLTGRAHVLDAPDTVSADASGAFSYVWVFRAGPGSALVAGEGWTGVENVNNGLHGDCFCIPELCTFEEGDSLTFFVNGDLTIPDQPGLVENWLILCEGEGFSAWTTIVPYDPTPVEIVPQSSVTALHAHPNPFEETVTLTVSLDGAEEAIVDVLDVRGRVIRGLWGGSLPPSPSTLRWHGRDRAGRRVAAGMYFVRLTAGDVSKTKKVVFLGRK